MRGQYSAEGVKRIVANFNDAVSNLSYFQACAQPSFFILTDFTLQFVCKLPSPSVFVTLSFLIIDSSTLQRL